MTCHHSYEVYCQNLDASYVCISYTYIATCGGVICLEQLDLLLGDDALLGSRALQCAVVLGPPSKRRLDQVGALLHHHTYILVSARIHIVVYIY